MEQIRKTVLAGIVAACFWIAPGSVAHSQSAEAADRLDELFVELAEPGRADWPRVEAEIKRIWSQSGSAAMDLLLRRAQDAMMAEDYAVAAEHLSALIDLAPDFAEGWNARATCYYFMDEYGLSLADIEQTLALNPRHFGALEGLASILEELDDPIFALRALRAAEQINPNRPSVQEAVQRLERRTGAIDL